MNKIQITPKIIQNYKKKTLEQLLADAKRYCHKYIRERDKINDCFFKCISCGQIKRIRNSINNSNYHAGHFFKAELCSALRFDERNINGQCNSCNTYLGGNEANYARNLRIKLGDDEFNKLNDDMLRYKRMSFKWDKIDLIDKIEYYKHKLKNLKNGFK